MERVRDFLADYDSTPLYAGDYRGGDEVAPPLFTEALGELRNELDREYIPYDDNEETFFGGAGEALPVDLREDFAEFCEGVLQFVGGGEDDFVPDSDVRAASPTDSIFAHVNGN
jgi:hypothetical protein